MSIRNMFESIMSEDADAAGDDIAGDGGGLMPEETDAGEDDPDDEVDELAGLGGLDEGEDEPGGLDADDFGEMDEGGDENVAELDHRLAELENEVGSLSSTVNTVRNENEQISESVDEVEENVRKLLDIYEMVTRGVNPFADDVDAGMAGGMGGDGFGLFDDEGTGGDETIDQDVAEADAEGFFEDDLPEEESPDVDVDDGIEPDDGVEPEDVDDEFEEFEDGETGGTSFEELKEEYEEEEADWGDEEPVEEDESVEADGTDDDDDGDDSAEVDGEADGEADDEPVAAPTTDHSTESGAADGAKPYLATLPDGVGADVVVIEWLEYLVGEAGVRETARAIEYYEDIDWIDEAVADALQDVLAGFEGGGKSASLSIDHHARSLEYIGELNGGGADAEALGRPAHGGGTDGVQR